MITLDYTLIIVGLGALILGASSGVLGSFAVLRQQSLLGDAISHAALPGIGIAFLLTLSKHPVSLMLGAMSAGWIGTMLVMAIVRNTKLKEDAALGIILSVFFGLGLLVLSAIQNIPTARQAGLSTYLFGSASTLLIQDVMIMVSLSLVTIIILFLLWKEFKLLCFDVSYCQTLGFPTKRLEVLLTSLMVVAIVIGLQSVGVVLMSALIIAPASAARQWTAKLGIMVILSAIFGAFSGLSGALISASATHIPTGPSIVLVVSTIVFISLLFAPNRGLIVATIRSRRAGHNIRANTMLTNLLLFSETQTDPYFAHDITALTAIGRGPARRALHTLKKDDLVYNPSGDRWGLTKAGFVKAKRVLAELENET